MKPMKLCVTHFALWETLYIRLPYMFLGLHKGPPYGKEREVEKGKGLF